MEYVNTFSGKSKVNPSEKPIPKPKTEVSIKGVRNVSPGIDCFVFLQQINLSIFALLFSEMVQYCQNRVSTVPELQSKWVLSL